MVIKCLECKHKCGLPFNLAFHYSLYHEDEISKCACVDKTLSGICIKELAWYATDGVRSPIKTGCSFKDESGYNSSSSTSSSSSNIYNSNCNSNCNSISNSSINSSSSINYNSNSNSFIRA